jgi:magnesium transporter
VIRIDVCQGKKILCDASVETLREALSHPDHVVWVDVFQPTDADWNALRSLFQFHELAIEDAQSQNQRAKLEVYDSYCFLSLRSWVGTKVHAENIPQATDEVDIFLGENYLVTIHNKEVISVRDIRKRWEGHPELPAHSPAFLLYLLVDAIVDGFYPALDTLNEEIDALETQVYSAKSNLDITAAMKLKRQLLILRQTIAPTRDVMNHLMRLETPHIASSVRLYLQDVYDHSLHLVEQVDLSRDMLSGALDAMVAQTSNRLNQIMKTMTALTTILATLTLIAGIYGMNFKHMPELAWKNGYFGALALMGLIAVALTAYFKRIKWF